MYYSIKQIRWCSTVKEIFDFFTIIKKELPLKKKQQAGLNAVGGKAVFDKTSKFKKNPL